METNPPEETTPAEETTTEAAPAEETTTEAAPAEETFDTLAIFWKNKFLEKVEIVSFGCNSLQTHYLPISQMFSL